MSNDGEIFVNAKTPGRKEAEQSKATVGHEIPSPL